MRVEIWGGVTCPWCYIGTARFEKALAGFEHRDQVEVIHRSFELDPGHGQAHVEPVHKMLADKYGPQGPGMDHRSLKQRLSKGSPTAPTARSAARWTPTASCTSPRQTVASTNC